MKLTQTAEIFCQDRGIRLTEPRKAVLEIIEKANKPLVAYDILEKLGKYLKNPKPPTAYRAIEFWQEHGFVHRIESLNAYISCSAGHMHKGSQYMICDTCGDVQEIHLCSMPKKLKEKAEIGGFKASYWNTEIHGQCNNCTKP